MAYSTAISRPVQLATRTLQWCSAVIVMGLTAYFISKGPTGQHLIYQQVIVRTIGAHPAFKPQPRPITTYKSNIKFQATLSVVFFLPAFVSPFLPTALSKFVLIIDVIFSYLYVSYPAQPIPAQSNPV